MQGGCGCNVELHWLGRLGALLLLNSGIACLPWAERGFILAPAALASTSISVPMLAV